MDFSNELPWDGTDLGWYNPSIIIQSWVQEGLQYNKVLISTATTNCSEYITCSLHLLKTPIPLILERCKSLFGLLPREHHTITIGAIRYIMYKVILDESGQPVTEPSISDLPRWHQLRHSPEFLHMVRRTILISDILHLATNYLSQIRIRETPDGYLPVSYFNGDSDLHREKSRPLSHRLMLWLGEDYETLVRETYNPEDRELGEVIDSYRTELVKIVESYGVQWLWIIPFILDRLSYYLILAE